MTFTHIHCSSRFDRSAESLEADLDTWMQSASLITLTEIDNDRRASRMAEKGWNYFNSKLNNGQDNCGMCWDTSVWVKKRTHVAQLENVRYQTLSHHTSPFVWAISVLLGSRVDDSTLMVSLTHLPAHIQGRGGFANPRGPEDQEWRARKLAYTTAMTTWSSTTKVLVKSWKPSATMCVADFNLDLKVKWVRDYLKDHWDSTGLQLAWRDFNSLGTSIDGGSRVIDGTLYKGMKLDQKPRIMKSVRSSDHRPYTESFELGKFDAADWEASGSIKGDPWWGFGDYHDTDEIFVDAATGASGGEVL